MTVFGARKYSAVARAYVHKLGFVQLLAFAAFGGLAVVLFEIGSWPARSHSELAFGVALCSMMLFAFVRRAIYLEIRPHLAVTATAAYAASCIGVALVWHRFADFSPADGLVVFAAGSGMGTVIGWWLSRRKPVHVDSDSLPSVRTMCHDHWQYGRWASGTWLVYTGGISVYPLIIAYMLGFEAAGVFRAIETLFVPVGQLFTALGTLGLPVIVAQRHLRGRQLSGSLVGLVLLGCGAVAVCYTVPVILFAPAIATYVFAKPEYASDVWVTAFIGIATVIAVVQSVVYLLLRSIERPYGEFWSQLSVTGITLTVGIGAGMLAGLTGIAAGLAAARSVGLIVALWLLGLGRMRSSDMQ
jgi:O-antigen/teichoic acid export membrane protein